MDTRRRLQDHDLTLLPQSRVKFRLGYSRDTETGPALSPVQEFDSNGAAYPVFTGVRREWNEYRLGAGAELAGFQFTVLRRWDFYKDDSPVAGAGAVAAGTAGDLTVLRQFRRSEPYHGSNPGWLGNLFTNRKHWALNARMTYVSGSRDFILNEAASGISRFGGAANRQILVSGHARRPVTAGDFSLSLFPSQRLTIVNNLSVHSTRIDGHSTYTEFNTGINLGTTLNFRYLGVRTVANSTDANYQAANWLGFRAGYHASDRLIRTIEALSIPGLAGSSQRDLYEQKNHLRAGTLGVRIRPAKPLTINLEGEVGRADHPLTPIGDRNFHTIGGRVEYRVRKLQLSASCRQVYNVNAPVSFSAFSSHSRNYSAAASWAPKGWFAIDASYTRLHLDTTSALAFFAGPARVQLRTAYSSLYVSNIHAASLGTRLAIRKRADLYLGYSITKDVGDGRVTAVPSGVSDPVRALLSSVQTFPLSFQSPLARVSVKITPKVRWNAAWQFYAYGEDFKLFAYAQNYHAHTGYTSVLWSF
jgi:hypothetical protein